MKVQTINIKEGYPPSDVAVANMEIEMWLLIFQLWDIIILIISSFVYLLDFPFFSLSASFLAKYTTIILLNSLISFSHLLYGTPRLSLAKSKSRNLPMPVSLSKKLIYSVCCHKPPRIVMTTTKRTNFSGKSLEWPFAPV